MPLERVVGTELADKKHESMPDHTYLARLANWLRLANEAAIGRTERASTPVQRSKA